MLSSRWTGPVLVGVAAAAALAGGDPGLLLVAVLALGVMTGAAQIRRGRVRDRQDAALARGGGYWRARLPVQSALVVWPDAPRRLAVYGPVPVELTAGAAGLTIAPGQSAIWFAGLAPREWDWSRLAGARRSAPAAGHPAAAGERGGVVIELSPAAGDPPGAVLLYADQPDALVSFIAERTADRH